MIKFSWHSEPGLAPHWYKIYGWLPNRYLPIVMFGDSIPIYKPNMKGGHTHNHVKNAHERMRRCRICDNPITKYEGFKAPWYGHICLDCYFEECNEEAYMCGIPFGWKKSDNFYRSFISRARKR